VGSTIGKVELTDERVWEGFGWDGTDGFRGGDRGSEGDGCIDEEGEESEHAFHNLGK